MDYIKTTGVDMNIENRLELESFKKMYNCDNSIGDLTPTVCTITGTRLPKQCVAETIAAIADQTTRVTGKIDGIEKVLIFCPDAAGEVQRQRFPDLFARVEKLAGFRFLSSAVMPSVTPVCFATIFSGAAPIEHGIRQYAKPVLSIETLFDVLAEAGKQVAIVSINTCSIDCIFRNRNIDYFSFRSDEASYEMTEKLIAEGKYDVIISYYTDYDSKSHKYGNWSNEAVDSLKTAVSYFEKLVDDTEIYWAANNRAVIWAPDHGNHMVDEKSAGHGQNIADDMVVNHYYRIRSKE